MKRNIYKGNPYTILFFRLLTALLLLSLSRMCLYFFNVNYFNDVSFIDALSIFFIGLRFDVAALMMISLPFIFFISIPFSFNKKELISKILLYITLILISLAIASNLIDVIYFRFTLKRSTFDIFDFLAANVGMPDILKALVVDFWYMIVLAVTMVFLLFYISTHMGQKDIFLKQTTKQLVFRSVLFLFIIGLSIVGLRGGLQLKPLNLIDAGRMVSSNQVPLVLNTPFSLIVTRGQEHLVSREWMTAEEALNLYSPVHQYNEEALLSDKKNVVILILESFSASRIGYFQADSTKNSLTPFLDSLLRKSLTFKGIANGKKSIEGIPAILSGIPTLTREAFLTSIYASNQISGISSILNKHGYTSAFFHGGKNGTMNLDSYAYQAGFDNYFGMNEYPDKSDYDGSWGIWDHDFYPFFKNKLDGFEQPFLAAFFSLSSHHPYAIPKEYQSKFTQKEAFDQSLAYSDFALSQFFKTAKEEDWFQNTLFVITADHSAELPGTRDSSNSIHFEIPIAFYAPNDSVLFTKPHRKIVQQSDIFPSVMDYLGIPETFVAFGNSIFDAAAPDFAMYYLNEIYHGFGENYIFEFNGEKFIFNKTSSTSTELDSQNQAIIEKQTKALIQNYADFMINNKLVVKKQ